MKVINAAHEGIYIPIRYITCFGFEDGMYFVKDIHNHIFQITKETYNALVDDMEVIGKSY